MSGVGVNEGDFYDEAWYYDSPLPPAMRVMDAMGREEAGAEGVARKSFLPRPLLFEVDFWINLPVGCDDPALGVDGALVNMTLWNVSNSRRFLVNQATASAAVAEIAAPEGMVACYARQRLGSQAAGHRLVRVTMQRPRARHRPRRLQQQGHLLD